MILNPRSMILPLIIVLLAAVLSTLALARGDGRVPYESDRRSFSSQLSGKAVSTRNQNFVNGYYRGRRLCPRAFPIYARPQRIQQLINDRQQKSSYGQTGNHQAAPVSFPFDSINARAKLPSVVGSERAHSDLWIGNILLHS